MLTCYLTVDLLVFIAFSYLFPLLVSLLTGYFIGWGHAVAQ